MDGGGDAGRGGKAEERRTVEQRREKSCKSRGTNQRWTEKDRHRAHIANVHGAAILEFDGEAEEARGQVESEHIGAVTRELECGATGAAAGRQHSGADRMQTTHE
jgi:hypothetical protein